ncbi:MAG: YdbH domain-containing protein, partial [Pseudomonadota bacterium]
ALASIDGATEVTRIEGGSIAAHWTLNGLGPATAWGRAQAAELTGAGVRNTVGALGGNGTLRFMGLNSGRSYERVLAAASNGVRGTPIGPIVDRLVGAVSALGRGASASSSYRFARSSDGAVRLALGNISVDAGSGAFFQVARPDAVQWSQGGGVRVALAGRFGGGGLPRGSFDVASRGPSLAALSGALRVEPIHHGGASLSLAPVRFNSDGGGTRFSTAVVMSGPLADGRIDGLSMPLAGRVMADGAFSIDGGCHRVAWQRIAVGQVVLNEGALPLCGASGLPLFRYDNSGLNGIVDSNSIALTGHIGGSPLSFQTDGARLNLATMQFSLVSPSFAIGAGDSITHLTATELSGARDSAGFGGRLTNATGNIGRVPFLFDQANGDWRWQDGGQGNELTLGAALQVTDAADEDRFQPLRSDDTRISYRDGAMRVTGSLMEPTSHARVADVAIAHDFADASGNARFTLANLTFARDGLQPVMLTTLSLGVAADVVGTVTGGGRVDWSRDGVTSSVGDFATETMDLSAAFGPVQGMSGAIHFSDLIALATPAGQEVRLRSVYPGVEVTDGVLLYQMLPGQRVHIEEGRWPFAGGQLLLRPTTLDFSADVPRFLTFDVQGVDAGLFLSRYEFDNINATGVFDGVLPTKFTADGGRVEGGLLQSRAGGHLEVVGELSQHDLGVYGNLAFGALKSLQYDNLAIRMNGNIDGEMLTEVHFSGLSQGANAQNNFITRAFRRLPFIFNININAPFRQLLTSARGLYDPSTLVGQNIEALVRAERDAAAAAANAAQPVQPAVRDNRR